jgi:hypothetical protein
VILVTDDLGEKPQEKMEEDKKSPQLRHRIKQMPQICLPP